MIKIVDKQQCCGCAACVDACSHRAIALVKDSEGFLYPDVHSDLCAQCGKCEAVCPMPSDVRSASNEAFTPKHFLATHKNFHTLFESGSGGVFSALANAVYKDKGFVGGAMTGDDYSAYHYISDQKSDLTRLRNIKYTQSDARGFYTSVRDVLVLGRPVLVVGCPCQIAALKIFLGKDYPNLFLVDFNCCGVSSTSAFADFILGQEKDKGSQVVEVKQLTKELGWNMFSMKLRMKDGRVVYVKQPTLPHRPSCQVCRFSHGDHPSDVTLSYFHGGKDLILKPEFQRNLGTSLVSLNSQKGECIFDAAKHALVVQEVSDEQSRVRDFCDVEPQGINKGRLAILSTLRSTLSHVRQFCRKVGCSPSAILRSVRHNGVRAILAGRPLIYLSKKTIFENRGTIRLSGDLVIGGPAYYQTEPVYSSIGIQHGGCLTIKGFTFFVYGADIEILENAKLEIGGEGGFNIGATIICGESIKIGKGVMAGRHVTIRDNNGGHWINFPGYKNSKPVEIGDHVWLCEGCTIMPGVKIGAGAIVGAKAVVFNNVPANTMVMGNPAQVVCDQVEWKY